jgi:hypothetical protein
MSTTPIPAPKAVRDMLTELLGREVTVDIGEPIQAGPVEKTAVAVYVDDQMGARATIVGDLAFAAYAGAAIGLVPVFGAEASIEDGYLSQNLVENSYEVFNIMASLFNLPNAPHLRLYQVVATNESPSADVTGMANALGQRLDLDLDIAGYGKGQLSIVVA